MTKLDELIDDLQRSLEGDAWHGLSMREMLDGVSAAEAAAHPIAGAHSIWEIVHHVTAWAGAAHARLRGEVTELEGETDWPPVRDASEQAWTAAFESLRRAQSALVVTLRTLRDADLDGPVPNRDYDRGHLLRGLIQHHAYHTGQVALLKRAVRHSGQG